MTRTRTSSAPSDRRQRTDGLPPRARELLRCQVRAGAGASDPHRTRLHGYAPSHGSASTVLLAPWVRRSMHVTPLLCLSAPGVACRSISAATTATATFAMGRPRSVPEWADNHCKASHNVAAWQQRRQQWKARQAAAATAKAGGAPAATAGAPQPRQREEKRWSCDAFYRALLQALRPCPASLHPCAPPHPSPPPHPPTSPPLHLFTLSAAAGVPEGRAAARRPALVDHAAPLPEAEPRIHDRPRAQHAARDRRPCRRPHGARRLAVRRDGHGKTAVVTALCLANPPAAPGGKAAAGGGGGSSSSTSTPQAHSCDREQHPRQAVGGRGEEVRAVAARAQPVPRRGRGRAAALANLGQVDVLITTPHAKWPAELCGDTQKAHPPLDR